MAGSPNSNLRGFNHAVHTLLKQPASFLPHLTIPTFTHLPENLGPHLVRTAGSPPSSATGTSTSTASEKPIPPRTPTIRALVLDKDNTLCPAKTTTFPPQILTKLAALRTSPTSPFHLATNPHSILIVSNRAGSHPAFDAEIRALEAQLAHLQIPVFRLPDGASKKPFCGDEVVRWFREREVVQSPHEIAVVGDRLGTDVIMAGMMGSWSVWCKEGVFEAGETGKPGRNILEKMEVWVERYLRGKGYTAPAPRGWES
ncbi:HAD-superfamily phosphatase subfamily IIIA [Penicillium hispanicum]|uniref:HAD-superfamily phosphatase subfamily IIIA n=1 Tax=Penicillium hispanicum TaxID=1080232 RepID=UPI0025406178|nr:HAD-superfamily phosphatase subfamily IIIA [Penicillium hispanicum]KAJ5584266.1 HAD-superfamily phosphatase subfamily IIIA [Penicillium hispanicum]